LDTTNVESLKSVAGIKLIAEGLQIIPGLSGPATIIVATISIGQGDAAGAGENLLGVVPLGGGMTKLGRTTGVARGSRFGDLPTRRGVERHHMPADSTTSISRQNGPAIQMEVTDHKRTSSWGNSISAKAYRENLKSLVDGRQMRRAMSMEVRDVRRVGGRKYNRAILEMPDYAKRSGYLNR
jgi:hypothetical protein